MKTILKPIYVFAIVLTILFALKDSKLMLLPLVALFPLEIKLKKEIIPIAHFLLGVGLIFYIITIW